MKASRVILYLTLLIAAGSFTILSLFVLFQFFSITDGAPEMIATGDRVGLVRLEGLIGDTD